MAPHTDLTDALVIGGGPAGLGLAAELAACGLGVRLVAPHPPRPFPATYGAWLDEVPGPVRPALAQVWTDVRAYTDEEPTPLLRPYALFDNARLLETLLARAGSGLAWTVGTVAHAERAGKEWEVRGAGGERWRARLVVDAGGHLGGLNGPTHPVGVALQTAFGIVAHFDRPPGPSGGVSWMDYRAGHLPPGGVRAAPTFLYTMHLGGDLYLAEETSLIARPGLTRELLERRLHARLAAQGTPPWEIESTEWVSFPMNTAAPAPGPVLAFGAAAGLVHPVSGFQVAGALADAPVVARAVASALDRRGPVCSVQAGWHALWPQGRRAAREVALLGVDALLALPGDALPAFFAAFFRLPAPEWHAFLAPRTGAGALARTMLRLFAQAPNPVRLPLARAALGQAGPSGRALRAAVGGN
ncbi:putative carotenoid cyclase [Deinococcus aetherius]|uniref:Carotenoid cyclase n=1 Tax=Deinococcus aetherius TaxID=200252 RepID=A0ABN6RFI4_9DEIO|nr:lycopene cyclase family protein [Deinococcus aetherius]BDP40793.1 putative carotenoid cyclase [Deinococcus aetherius]